MSWLTLYVVVNFVWTELTIGCPEDWTFGANYGKKFTLPVGKLHYVIIGGDGSAGVGLLAPTKGKNKFTCDRQSLGVGAGYQRDRSGLLNRHVADHAVCCYATPNELIDEEYINDNKILPSKLIDNLQNTVERTSDKKKAGQLPKEHVYTAGAFKWFIDKDKRFLSLAHTKEKDRKTSKKYNGKLEARFSPNMLDFSAYIADATPCGKFLDPPEDVCRVEAGTLAGFIVSMKDGAGERIVFAESGNGRFDLSKLLPEMAGQLGKASDVVNVRYFSVDKLWEAASEHVPIHLPTAKWVLGSSCSACPSTSMTIKITESEAQMHKKQFSEAINTKAWTEAKAGGSVVLVSVEGKAGGSVAYTEKTVRESAKTFSSGKGTTISGTCNGFYMYYYAITLPEWNQNDGDNIVPTERFYCSDWDTPPICLPKIADMPTEDLHKVCKGDDNPADFCGELQVPPPPKEEGQSEVAYQRVIERWKNTRQDYDDSEEAQKIRAKRYDCYQREPTAKKQKWWSKHQGRPQPLRVVGSDTKNGRFKPLKTAGAQYVESYGDYMKESAYEYQNAYDKGIFEADIVYDGEEYQEDLVHPNNLYSDRRYVDKNEEFSSSYAEWIWSYFIFGFAIAMIAFIGCCFGCVGGYMCVHCYTQQKKICKIEYAEI